MAFNLAVRPQPTAFNAAAATARFFVCHLFRLTPELVELRGADGEGWRWRRGSASTDGQKLMRQSRAPLTTRRFNATHFLKMVSLSDLSFSL